MLKLKTMRVRVYQMVRLTGIEPVCPLFRKAADFKSAVSTYFTTVARQFHIEAAIVHFRGKPT